MLRRKVSLKSIKAAWTEDRNKHYVQFIQRKQHIPKEVWLEHLADKRTMQNTGTDYMKNCI